MKTEFMLCRQEEGDPRKCLKEGKDVTACGIDFLQKEYDNYATCIEHRSGPRFAISRCRAEQRGFDDCMWEKLNVDRPPIGAVSKLHIHDTTRAPPPPDRDYKAEAAKVMTEIPYAEIETRQDYFQVKDAARDWFADI